MTTNSGRLAGRVAIVTGAGAGIGKAIARMFAAQGAQLVLADRDEVSVAQVAEEIAASGAAVTALTADISRSQDVAKVVAHATERFGGLHILINNAAAYQNDGTLMAVSEETWDLVMAVNLKGPWLCMRDAVTAMKNSGGGSIVNISSVNALFGLSLAAYSASKGGLLALTRLAALELGPLHIRVNAICPGTIMTDNSKAVYAERPGLEAAVTAMYPMGRLGEPDDIAHCAAYLASDEAKFVTGATFSIDGGLTAGRTFDLNYAK